MTTAIVITCDTCRATEREDPPAMLYGWLHLQPAKRSEVESIPEAKGDFCSVKCMQEFLDDLVVQARLPMFGEVSITRETAEKAEALLEDTPIEAEIKSRTNGNGTGAARVGKSRKRTPAAAE